MENKALVLAQVCERLEMGDQISAAAALDSAYPFVRLVNVGRSYTPTQMAGQFLRDGFVDRFSGDRLIFPPVLRVLSMTMPDRFPFHTNWKFTETHPAYWDLGATLDHVIPVSRGGADDESNWATTSMARNAAKGNSTLDQIGWTMHPAGDLRDWDGLTSWFSRYVAKNPDARSDPYLRRWAKPCRRPFCRSGIAQHRPPTPGPGRPHQRLPKGCSAPTEMTALSIG